MLSKPTGAVFLLIACATLSAQNDTLTGLALGDAYHLLEARYPLLRNGELVAQLEQTQQAQLTAERRPIISLKADGRLQSESVNLQSDNEMFPIDISRPLVNGQAYLDANYLLLDGGIHDARQKMITAQNAVQLQQQEVDRYQLRNRINQLFLTITALREQLLLLDISLDDLQERKAQVAAGVEYGVLLVTELTKLEVKEQEIRAQQENLAYQIQGALQSLELLLDIRLSPTAELVYPTLGKATELPPIQRPEQQLFQLQQEAILSKSQLAATERKPKLNLFAQAGVGYPNPLNFLDSGAAPYGIIGVGFSWKLVDWDKTSLQQETYRLQAEQIQNTRETFEFNLQQGAAKYRSDLARIYAQIERDQQIATLQAEILEQMAAQLEEGVITSSDYVNQLNAELRARQNIAIHTTQLLQVQLTFWNQRGMSPGL